MGIPSQRRGSNIKKMMQSAANRNRSRSGNFFGTRLGQARKQHASLLSRETNEAAEASASSVPQRDKTKPCRACTEKDYKKGHELTCPKSVYFGKSLEEIDSMKMAKTTKNATRIAGGAARPVAAVLFNTRPTQAGFDKLFKPFKPLKDLVCRISSPRAAKTLRRADAKPLAFDMSPAALKQVVETAVATPGAFKFKTKAPPAIEILTKHLLTFFPGFQSADSNNLKGSTDRELQQLEWYKRTFPIGNPMCVVIPYQDPRTTPCRLYAAAEGCKIYFPRWELVDKDLKCCYCAHGTLIHPRQLNFSKNGTIIPLFEIRQKLGWVVGGSYKCNNADCGKSVLAWDPELIHSLPYWMQRSYPVSAQWLRATNQQQQLSRDLTALIEHSLVATSSGDAVGKLLQKDFSDLYLTDEECYVEAIRTSTCLLPAPFVSFSEWLGKNITLPTGRDCRDAYLVAKGESKCTPSGYTDKMRANLEMQAVGAAFSTAIDHTFGTLKNYNKMATNMVDGAGKPTAICTQGTETGEFATALIVPDTKMSTAAHGLEQVVRRPNFRPKMIYLDTFPHLDDFVKSLFGDTVQGRLGLFHYMHRITSTLRKEHPDFYLAIKGLKAAVYTINENDTFAVHQALRDGTLNGILHEEEDIADLQKSKAYNKYGKYLRKRIHSPKLIAKNLEKWWEDFKLEASDGKPEGRGRRYNGKGVFTALSRDAFLSAVDHAQYITDLVHYSEMYEARDPPEDATHSLTSYVSLRGVESKLEKGHDILCNLANTGMRHELADLITLIGITGYNARIREMVRQNRLSPSERKAVHPSYRNIPFQYDESRRLNEETQKAGLPKPYPNAKALQEDNKERFLWEYYEEQALRDQKQGRLVLGCAKSSPHRCQCNQCELNPVPLPYILATIPAEKKDEEQEPSHDEFFDTVCGNETISTSGNAELDEFGESNEAFLADMYSIMEDRLPPYKIPKFATISSQQNATPPHASDRVRKVPDQFSPTRTIKRRLVAPRSPSPPSVKQLQQRWQQPLILVPPTQGQATLTVPPAQTIFCCNAYGKYCYEHLLGQMGRPPHDKDCPVKHPNAFI